MNPVRLLQFGIITIAAFGLLLPPIAAGLLGFQSVTHGFSAIPLIEAFGERSVLLPTLNTLWLVCATVALGFALVIPTLIWLHLQAPRLLPIAESISLLPYIVPPIALVSGVSLALRPLAPGFFANIVSLIPFYVLITLPFTYRAIDSGLRTLDLPTLFQASESLGAGRLRTILTVILPNLKRSLLVGTVLAATMITGEFVISSLLLHHTFPTMLVELGQSKVRIAAALSFVTMMATWLLMAALMSGRNRNRSDTTTALAL